MVGAGRQQGDLFFYFVIFLDLSERIKLEDNIWKIRWMNEEGGVSAPVHILTVNLENCDFHKKK